MSTSTARGYLAKELAVGIAKAREDRGQTQRGAAEALGVSHITLRELETGTANPTLARIEDVAAGLDLDVTITVKPRKRARK